MEVRSYARQEPADAEAILRATAFGRRVFIDISGMSRLLIVQLIAMGVRLGMLDKISVIYTEAAHYPPTQAEVEGKLEEDNDVLGILNFISSGVFSVMVVPELSTVAMQGQPIRLIAFPSFNATQFAAVCAEIQAATFAIVNGVPPRRENRWRREAIRRINNIDSLREKEEFDLSTLDYRETLQLLLREYSDHGALEKLVISPTGSKMQAVAVGIACGFLRDLQVVYPTPKEFTSPSNYTHGAVGTYSLELAGFANIATNLAENN